jgi:hypothetical protein
VLIPWVTYDSATTENPDSMGPIAGPRNITKRAFTRFSVVKMGGNYLPAVQIPIGKGR